MVEFYNFYWIYCLLVRCLTVCSNYYSYDAVVFCASSLIVFHFHFHLLIKWFERILSKCEP